jgi:hypothetical protein
VTLQQELEREPARWLAGKDFRGRVPVAVSGDPSLFGTAMADAESVSGWARNDQLAPPEWSGPPLARGLVQVPLPLDAIDAAWAITLTRPEDGSVTEVEGRSSLGVLSFEIEGPFESIAFDARRGEVAEPPPPVCPSVDGGTCAGPVYGLALDGVSLFADPECPTAQVELVVTECRGRRSLSLSSCPSDGVTEPRSCIQLEVAALDGEPSGAGTYYDSVGAQFDLVIGEAELGGDDSNQDTIRAGVLRGSSSRNGGDGSSQPFELSFSACSRPTRTCLF